VEQIKTFTQSTDAWAVKNRSQFANSSFVLWGGENTKGIQLVADHEHANVADKGVDVPVFQPLEYELPGGSLDDATMIPPSTFADPQKSHLYVNATYYREDGSAVRSTMGPLSFDLTTSWTVHVATPVPDQKCRRQNGMYKGSQRCEVFGKLKGMCMQVRGARCVACGVSNPAACCIHSPCCTLPPPPFTAAGHTRRDQGMAA
jgi:hypothetical protein